MMYNDFEVFKIYWGFYISIDNKTGKNTKPCLWLDDAIEEGQFQRFIYGSDKRKHAISGQS